MTLLVCLLHLLEAVNAAQVFTSSVPSHVHLDKEAAADVDSRGTMPGLQSQPEFFQQAQTAKQFIRKRVRAGSGGGERTGSAAIREDQHQAPATMDCDDWLGTDFLRVYHQFAGCQEFARRLNARIGDGKFHCGAQDSNGRSLLLFREKSDQTKFVDWLERTLSIPKSAVHIFNQETGLMYWHCGRRNDPNNNLNKLNRAIKSNICKCGHGAPATHCTKDGANICSSCTGSYHLSSQTCKANVCKCHGGTAAVGGACTGNGANICTTCNKGYHLSQKSCKANVCKCQSGTKAVGGACTGNGLNICTACIEGYHLKDKSCKANLCTCKGGTPATGKNCKSNQGAVCAECNAGYHKANDACLENECSCPDGVAANGTDCDKDKAVKCSGCNTGYELSNVTCELKDSAKSFGPLLGLPAMLAFWTLV
eukprot:TRINITY_DN6512_c0_g1_i3.p1 TRINITY_DN6512_c0_g1~~TRINITY_DN6512_c0_g1_i3.p1  ORF type:complete len:424 (+),score=43.10 TRINITY_DN6512_c0_g1_i3:63-1334(+)